MSRRPLNPTPSDPVQSLVNRVEAWVQEETGAQGRMIELLREQEDAIRSGEAVRVAECGQAVERALSSVPARERRRREVVGALAAAWGVSPATLTLTSICARLGQAGERLDRQRLELREATAKALRLGRRIAVLARFHRELFEEVVGILVGRSEGDPKSKGAEDTSRGALLNTKA